MLSYENRFDCHISIRIVFYVPHFNQKSKKQTKKKIGASPGCEIEKFSLTLWSLYRTNSRMKYLTEKKHLLSRARRQVTRLLKIRRSNNMPTVSVIHRTVIPLRDADNIRLSHSLAASFTARPITGHRVLVAIARRRRWRRRSGRSRRSGHFFHDEWRVHKVLWNRGNVTALRSIGEKIGVNVDLVGDDAVGAMPAAGHAPRVLLPLGDGVFQDDAGVWSFRHQLKRNTSPIPLALRQMGQWSL